MMMEENPFFLRINYSGGEYVPLKKFRFQVVRMKRHIFSVLSYMMEKFLQVLIEESEGNLKELSGRFNVSVPDLHNALAALQETRTSLGSLNLDTVVFSSAMEFWLANGLLEVLSEQAEQVDPKETDMYSGVTQQVQNIQRVTDDVMYMYMYMLLPRRFFTRLGPSNCVLVLCSM
jgi:hypothetical protein